jgi:DNA polymerase III epsilon subunit-like protein
MSIFITCAVLLILLLLFVNQKTDTKTVKDTPHTEGYISNRLKELSKLPPDNLHGKGRYLFFDTETTGLPVKRNESPQNLSNWPYIVQIAWMLVDEHGLQIANGSNIIKQNVSISYQATAIHHITTEKMLREGVSPQTVYADFLESVENTEYIIAHNLEFDLPILECELLRNGFDNTVLKQKKYFCTMKYGKELCRVYDRTGRRKNPKLSELFGELYFSDSTLQFEGLHSAAADMLVTYRCFMKMKQKNPALLTYKQTDYPLKPAVYDESDNETNDVIGKYTNKPNSHILQYLSDQDVIDYFCTYLFDGVQVLVTGTGGEDKEKCWQIITELNGKVVKSVTKNLTVVVIGAAPGPKKIESITYRVEHENKDIVLMTESQLYMLYDYVKSNKK